MSTWFSLSFFVSYPFKCSYSSVGYYCCVALLYRIVWIFDLSFLKLVFGPHLSCSLLRMIFLLQFRTEQLWMEHHPDSAKGHRHAPNNWDWSHRVTAGDYFRVKGFLCGCLGAGRAEFSLLQHYTGLFPSVLQKPKLTSLSSKLDLTSCYCRSDQTCLR